MAAATSVNRELWFKFITCLFFSSLFFRPGHPISDPVPAGIYMFGDSLLDVGNNNYISDTILKADFAHNGVDFPGGKATGRFSNGKNAADFLAEKVGLPVAPPYLSLVSNDTKLIPTNTNAIVTGVSFASGGAGILNGTNQLFESIPLAQQIDYYTSVHEKLVQQLGSPAAKTHLAKSLFVIVIGSNDLLSYFDNDSQVSKEYTPKQYVGLMASTLKQLIKRLYGLGARKFVVTGVGVIGCCPVQRLQNTTNNSCNVRANHWSRKYNKGLRNLRKELKLESSDINYSYFNTYCAMNALIQKPLKHGIVEIKEACCGLGKLKAEFPCMPVSSYCSNRSDHLFWDLYHPTETVSRRFADLLYNGSRHLVLPMNVQHLVHM